MIKGLIHKFFLTFLMLAIPILVIAQPSDFNNEFDEGENTSFEGVIKFTWKKFKDTTYYTYSIKDNFVRVDIHENCEGCKAIENWLIFDLKESTITAYNPSRNIYKDINVKPYAPSSDENYKVTAGNSATNKKQIHGYECKQWRVKNIKENTEVAFWVANDNFDFFTAFLKLWNRTERHAQYYLKIPNTMGYFPLLSVERTILREEKQKLMVTDIEKKKLNISLFSVPESFRSYE